MLKKGETIPNLLLKGSDGKEHQFSDFIGKPLVLYFYPKNETPGCVAEACSFRDSYEDFLSLGAEVVGVSGDSVKSHMAFSKNRRLPFLLLSDSDRKAEKAFDVPRNLFGLLPGRVTFIFDAHGKLVYSFESSSRPTAHITKALEIVKKL